MSVCLYADLCEKHKNMKCILCGKNGCEHKSSLFYYESNEVVCEFSVKKDNENFIKNDIKE